MRTSPLNCPQRYPQRLSTACRQSGQERRGAYRTACSRPILPSSSSRACCWSSGPVRHAQRARAAAVPSTAIAMVSRPHQQPFPAHSSSAVRRPRWNILSYPDRSGSVDQPPPRCRGQWSHVRPGADIRPGSRQPDRTVRAPQSFEARELQVQGTFHVKHLREPWLAPHDFDEVDIAPPHREPRG